MPYCPKCDMEFIDGITVCSDCGGPLVESEEAAKAMKAQEEKERLERQKAELDALKETVLGEDGEFFDSGISDHEALDGEDGGEVSERPAAPVRVYVNKAQKYDDLKSSASAFLIVGGVMLAAAILCWAGIVKLPMAGASKLILQSALTVMGVLALLVAAGSTRSAKKLAPQIEDENRSTRELIQWFTDTYTGEELDQSIEDAGSLPPEELSLKRFSVIQDRLVTSHDLPDQAYVDALSEEIYGKLYE